MDICKEESQSFLLNSKIRASAYCIPEGWRQSVIQMTLNFGSFRTRPFVILMIEGFPEWSPGEKSERNTNSCFSKIGNESGYFECWVRAMDFVRTVSESLIKAVCVKDEDDGTVLVVEAFEQELALNRASPTLWPGVVGVGGFKKTESVPYLIGTRSRHVTATGGYLVHLSKTRCWQLLR